MKIILKLTDNVPLQETKNMIYFFTLFGYPSFYYRDFGTSNEQVYNRYKNLNKMIYKRLKYDYKP